MQKRSNSQWIQSDFIDLASSSEFPSNKSKSETFLTKYEPQTKIDLAVHKAKITDVEQWLKISLSSRRTSKFLLLVGPSGCGKTATIKVLAKEMKLSLVEWSNNQNYQTWSKNAQTDINNVNQSTDFRDFLLRTEKCVALNISSSSKNSKKLIVVEEFPYSFVREPPVFWRILREIRGKISFPVIFICSDDQTNRQKCGEYNYKRLFPQTINEELEIQTISFNPVSHTNVVKVLRKIFEQEKNKGGKILGKRKNQNKSDAPEENSVIEKITEACNGDIRSAVNSLEFFLCDQKLGSEVFEKDASLNLFHALGKFLYSKRIDDDVIVADGLPKHLDSFARPKLTFDPESVVDQSGVDPSTFALFLHENYLHYIGDVEAALGVAASFSYADSLTGKFSLNDQLADYVGSLVGRSVAFSCYNQKLEKCWRSTRKPAFLTVCKNVRKNFADICETFQVEQTRYGAATSLDIFPYLTKLSNIRLHAASQWQLVEQIGSMPIKKLKGSTKNTSSFQQQRVENDYDLSLVLEDFDSNDMIPNVLSPQESLIHDNENDNGIVDMIDEYDDE